MHVTSDGWSSPVCPACGETLVPSEHTPWVRTCGRCDVVCVFKQERDDRSSPHFGVKLLERVDEAGVWRPPPVSDRQLQVLDGVAHGLEATEIAKALGITYETVRGHQKRCYRRLGARNAAHAVYLAVELGLLE